MTHEYKMAERCAARVRSGFTLIELMIGIVIIGILVGGAMYTAMTVMENAKRSATSNAIQTIKTSLMLYKQEKGDYPKALQDLIAAGFLKKPMPKDGWDHSFVYRVTPDGKHPYELFSYGPQGKAGGKASRIDAWSK
jgi:general secretion pathway protein G